ncbi:hypothetical protein [Streptomyces sp. NPDC088178]
MPSPGPTTIHLALLPLLTIFGLLYPAGLVALYGAMQVLNMAKNWDKQAA